MTTARKKYGSVAEMIGATAGDAKLAAELETEIAERALIKQLVIHRVRANLSQGDLAATIGCSQSKISKFEAARDADLKLQDVLAYTGAMGLDLHVTLLPAQHAAAAEIKYHALRIKELLHSLVELADKDDTVADGVARFVYLETPVNLLKILVEAAQKLPQQTIARLRGISVGDATTATEENPENSDSGVGVGR